MYHGCMKLLIWLGNPGDKYAKTRHNAGFLALEQLCEAEWFTPFLPNKKFFGYVANGMLDKWQIIAFEPQNFMNKSGKPVQQIFQYYKVEYNDILIIQDDIDLPFGQIKLKFAGSSGGHNGIKDIQATLGTDRFRRLKIGIGRPEHAWYSVTDYVLSNFSSAEMKWFASHEKEIRERIGDYLKNTW